MKETGRYFILIPSEHCETCHT